MRSLDEIIRKSLNYEPVKLILKMAGILHEETLNISGCRMVFKINIINLLKKSAKE